MPTHLLIVARLPVGFLPFWLAASGWSLAWQIARFALPLIALRTTSSPFRISLVSLALTLPWLLVALPAGALADRLTRSIVVRGATAVFAVGSIVLVASILSDRLPFGLILLVTFVLGAANVQNVIAFSAATADVVPEEAIEGAIARLIASDTLAEIIGPAIGGALILAGIVFAPGSALLLALGVIALIGSLRVRPHAHAVVAEPASPWSGLGVLRRDRLLLTITAMACAINLAWSAWSSIFVLYAVAPGPVGLSAGTYGILLTAAGVGGFAGSLLAIPVRRRAGRPGPYLINILVNAAMFGASALTASPWPIGLSLILGDFGGPGWAVLTLTAAGRTRHDPAARSGDGRLPVRDVRRAGNRRGRWRRQRDGLGHATGVRAVHRADARLPGALVAGRPHRLGRTRPTWAPAIAASDMIYCPE